MGNYTGNYTEWCYRASPLKLLLSRPLFTTGGISVLESENGIAGKCSGVNMNTPFSGIPRAGEHPVHAERRFPCIQLRVIVLEPIKLHD